MVAPVLSVSLTPSALPLLISRNDPVKLIVPPALSSAKMPICPATPWVTLPNRVIVPAVDARSWISTARPLPLVMLPK
jgi:hypothetical protein